MTVLDDYLRECETWIGTPYRHQVTPGIKGVATDCVGLPRGIAQAMGFEDKSDISPRYGRVATGNLRRLLAEHMNEVDELRPGDLILFGTPNDEHHVGIYTEKGVIHGNERVGRVVRTSYGGKLRQETRAFFRFKELS